MSNTFEQNDATATEKCPICGDPPYSIEHDSQRRPMVEFECGCIVEHDPRTDYIDHVSITSRCND